jgi:hypothetical protein
VKVKRLPNAAARGARIERRATDRSGLRIQPVDANVKQGESWQRQATRRRVELVPPKVPEPIRCELRVTDRALDVAAPQIVLQGACVMAVIGEFEPADVAQHVGVGGEGQPGGFACPGDQLPDIALGQRPDSLGRQQGGPMGAVTND